MKIKIDVTYDRLIMELDIIEHIFQAQFQIYPEGNLFLIQYPSICNENGQSGVGINGKYIAWMDIFSDVELFNIPAYKEYFIKRFESANNQSVIINELTNIRDKAIRTRNFYNSNLIGENKTVINTQKDDEHNACISISRYHIMGIYFGCNRMNNKYLKNVEFNYISDNHLLATICQDIIDFANMFNIKYSNKDLTKEKEWESFIDPLVINSFLEVEQKATAGTGTFPTSLRCAAFCEMIYYGQKLNGKPFMIKTKKHVVTMADFALSRYQIRIKPSLNGGEKKKRRLAHQTHTVKGLPPLKNYF